MQAHSEPVHVLAPNPGVMTLDGTNTWVIPGDGGSLVIDPGPDIASHAAAVEAHGPVAALLLTHRHDDHSGAVPLFDAGVPVYAALPELARGVPPLRHDDVIEVAGVRLEVLGMPGHTTDSVGFRYRAGSGPILFTGDALLGGLASTLLVARDGGNLGDYLGTLEALGEYAGWRGLPGHGPVIDDVAAHGGRALAHRRSRVEQLREALAADPDADLADIAARRYPDEPQRQRAALRMIEVEAAYLRGE